MRKIFWISMICLMIISSNIPSAAAEPGDGVWMKEDQAIAWSVIFQRYIGGDPNQLKFDFKYNMIFHTDNLTSETSEINLKATTYLVPYSDKLNLSQSSWNHSVDFGYTTAQQTYVIDQLDHDTYYQGLFNAKTADMDMISPYSTKIIQLLENSVMFYLGYQWYVIDNLLYPRGSPYTQTNQPLQISTLTKNNISFVKEDFVQLHYKADYDFVEDRNLDVNATMHIAGWVDYWDDSNVMRKSQIAVTVQKVKYQGSEIISNITETCLTTIICIAPDEIIDLTRLYTPGFPVNFVVCMSIGTIFIIVRKLKIRKY